MSGARYSFPLKREDAERLFAELDKNHDGTLSASELDAIFRMGLRLPPTSADQRAAFFERLDTNEDAAISLDEFVHFCNVRQAELRQVFDDIRNREFDADADGDGRDDAERNGVPRDALSVRTLRRASTAVGISLSDDDVETIMLHLDRNSDGLVTFDEFVESLLLTPAVNPSAVFEQWRRRVWLDIDADMASPMFELVLTRAQEQQGRRGVAQAVAISAGSAGVAGCAAKTLTAPLDIVKMQIMANGVSTREAVRSVRSRPLGWRSFWTGNLINCTKAFPETATRILTFSTLCKSAASDPDRVKTIERLAFGAFAGGLSATVTYPLEVARVRMMTCTQSRGLLGTLASLRGGSMFAGLSTTLISFVPFASIDLTVNSVIREAVTRHYVEQHRAVPDVPLLLSAALVANGTASLVTHPLSNVRVVQQAQGVSRLVAFSQIAVGGPRAFFRGLFVTLLRTVPSGTVSCLVFNLLHRELQGVR